MMNKQKGDMCKKCKYCEKEFYKIDYPKCFNRMITCGSKECKKLYKKEWTFSNKCINCKKPISYLAQRCKICSSIGENNPFYNKKHSQEVLQKINLFKKGETSKRKGEKLSNFSKIKISISKRNISPEEWKDFAVSLNKRIRRSTDYVVWRKKVFKRDNYTCQECGECSGNGKSIFLEAHHKKSFVDYPELRFDVNNGITYCSNCHSIKDKNRKRFIPQINILKCP